jgi:hypothetical protein
MLVRCEPNLSTWIAGSHGFLLDNCIDSPLRCCLGENRTWSLDPEDRRQLKTVVLIVPTIDLSSDEDDRGVLKTYRTQDDTSRMILLALEER